VIPFLLLAAAMTASSSSADEARFVACSKLVETDPAKAVAEADAWRVANGGLLARQCLGLAYSAQGRWAPAAVVFEQAARDAEIRRDGRAATLWVQTGNAALAGDDPAKARLAFDRALALPVLSKQMQGETWLDRARAGVALKDLAGARADLDKAIGLVPADPMVWLLSANLALRQNDLPRAQGHIAEAVRLAPDDAAVAYEAGNVAAASGADEAARVAWQRAVQAAPDSPEGRAAAAALAAQAEDKAAAPK
jgi:tetratricopeptide (TPR) repeat protein